MLNRATLVAALLAAPVAVLAGCNDTQKDSSQTTTSPPTSSNGTPSAQSLKVQLKSADGKPVADAIIDFAGGYATVTVETVGGGILSPGSHGMHIHSVGKCEPNSVAPAGGPPGNFLSAGGHLQASGHTGHPASGDLTPLNIRADGSGKVVATSDAFTAEDLKGPQGSALIIHQGEDNFANIPPRYTHDGVPGPDAETMATGDAGARVACAVLTPASGPAPSGSSAPAAPPAPSVPSATTPTVTESSSAPASPGLVTPSTSANMPMPTVTPTTGLPIHPNPGYPMPGRP